LSQKHELTNVLILNNFIWILKLKVKLPLYKPQRYLTGVEVELLSFLTLAWGGGEWSAPLTSCSTSRDRIPVAIELEDGWAPEVVCTFWSREILLPLPGFQL